MTPASHFYTATMARLYADQGYWRKAAEIYRHLLAQDPHRQDLHSALAVVEERIAGQDKPNLKELSLLVNEWIALQKEYNRRNRRRRHSAIEAS